MKVYARIKSKMIVDCAIAAVKSKLKFSPFLTCLDFGVCKAIRLVRFGYNTFTGCVA